MNTSQVTLPTTPTCRVNYIKDGVTYFIGLNTPKDDEGYRKALEAKRVDINQVISVEPIHPRPPIQRNHPAAQQMSRYMSFSD